MCRRRNAHVLSDRCCQCPEVQVTLHPLCVSQSFTSPLPDNIRFWPWMQSPLLPPLGGAYRQKKQAQLTDRQDCDACCVRRGRKAVEVALDSLLKSTLTMDRGWTQRSGIMESTSVPSRWCVCRSTMPEDVRSAGRKEYLKETTPWLSSPE